MFTYILLPSPQFAGNFGLTESNMAQPKTSLTLYIEQLNQYVSSGGWPSEFDRRRLMRAADAMQATDACQAFTLRGAIASLDGDTASSIMFHEKALKTAPNDTLAISNYGASLVNLGMSASGLEKVTMAFDLVRKSSGIKDHEYLAERYVRQLILSGYAERALSVIAEIGDVMPEKLQVFKQNAESIKDFCQEYGVSDEVLESYNVITGEIMRKAQVSVLTQTIETFTNEDPALELCYFVRCNASRAAEIRAEIADAISDLRLPENPKYGRLIFVSVQPQDAIDKSQVVNY